MEKFEFRFNEDKVVETALDHIKSTYNQHYVSKSEKTNDLQVVDVWDMVGIAEQACISNVIKYAARFGKKEGRNKADLLKMIHYAILAYNFAVIQKTETTDIPEC